MHTCSVGGLGRVQAGRLGRVEAGAAALKGNLLAARLVARTGGCRQHRGGHLHTAEPS